MKRSAFVPLALLLLSSGCASPSTQPSPTTTTKTVGGKSSGPLVALLAASACREIDERLFALSSTGDDHGVIDLYVMPKRCSATQARDVASDPQLDLSIDAYAWLAVDRELGSVRVREFVHTTVHLNGRLSMTASYAAANERLNIAFTAHQPTIRVEPVGALQLDALSWASLLALELAPSTGTSPESLAKQKLREEAERTLKKALSVPLVISYNGKTGATSFGDSKEANANANTNANTNANANANAKSGSYRIVPRGSALIGPFDPAEAATSAQVTSDKPTKARAVCASHAERLLNADRRGDAVFTDSPEWTATSAAANNTTIPIPAMPCPWFLAIRGPVDQTTVATVKLEPRGSGDKGASRSPSPSPSPSPATTAAEGGERWISIDRADVELGSSAGAVDIVIGTDTKRITLYPQRGASGHATPPNIFTLSPNEALVIRAIDPSSKAIRGSVSVDPALLKSLASIEIPSLAKIHLEARVVAVRP